MQSYYLKGCNKIQRDLKQTIGICCMTSLEITGNCIADELAKKETALTTVSSTYNLGIPLSSQKYLLRLTFTRRSNTRLQSETICNVSKIIRPLIEINRIKSLLLLSITNSVITVHCLMRTHGRRLGFKRAAGTYMQRNRWNTTLSLSSSQFVQYPISYSRKFGRPLSTEFHTSAINGWNIWNSERYLFNRANICILTGQQV